eukprot:scaffold1057_cov459-Prasinococcus_capsulatus_cf.AAC.3
MESHSSRAWDFFSPWLSSQSTCALRHSTRASSQPGPRYEFTLSCGWEPWCSRPSRPGFDAAGPSLGVDFSMNDSGRLDWLRREQGRAACHTYRCKLHDVTGHPPPRPTEARARLLHTAPDATSQSAVVARAGPVAATVPGRTGTTRAAGRAASSSSSSSLSGTACRGWDRPSQPQHRPGSDQTRKGRARAHGPPDRGYVHVGLRGAQPRTCPNPAGVPPMGAIPSRPG